MLATWIVYFMCDRLVKCRSKILIKFRATMIADTRLHLLEGTLRCKIRNYSSVLIQHLFRPDTTSELRRFSNLPILINLMPRNLMLLIILCVCWRCSISLELLQWKKGNLVITWILNLRFALLFAAFNILFISSAGEKLGDGEGGEYDQSLRSDDLCKYVLQ